MAVVLVRRQKTQNNTHKGEYLVKIEAEIGVMLPEARDAWGHWKLEGSRRTLPLEV